MLRICHRRRAQALAQLQTHSRRRGHHHDSRFLRADAARISSRGACRSAVSAARRTSRGDVAGVDRRRSSFRVHQQRSHRDLTPDARRRTEQTGGRTGSTLSRRARPGLVLEDLALATARVHATEEDHARALEELDRAMADFLGVRERRPLQ